MFELKDNFGREPGQPARRGKIARLPNDIRDLLNQRLLDGQSASIILPWLNNLPPVKDLLAAQFAGAPVTAQNLSNWRTGGYQHWLRDQKHICQIKQLGDHAASMSPDRRDHIAAGTATIASAHIFESLSSISSESLKPDDLVKIARAATSLTTVEQHKARLKLLDKRLGLKDKHLELMQAKMRANREYPA